MKTKLFIHSLSALFAVFLIMCYIAGCEKDKPDDEIIHEENIEAIISSGGNYEIAGTTYKHDDLSPVLLDSTFNDTTKCICSVTHWDVLTHSGEQLLFENQSSVIYPGNLLQGNSLTNEIPSVIVVERAGGTISYDLNDGNLKSFFNVDQVTKSSIQNAMNNIISNSSSLVPSNFRFDYEEVQSYEQLSLSLGLDVKYGKFKMTSDLSFSKDKQYNRYLVKLTQVYYSMSFDFPTSIDKIFAPSVTAADLSKYVYAGNPATYISDVSYGRFFYMLIESTSSSEEIKAAIEASFSGIAKVAVEADVCKMENLSELRVKVIAYGGDAKGTMELSGLVDIHEIADRLAQSTEIKAGLPLSYVVRNVVNNEIVNIRMAAEYDVYDCWPALVDYDGNVYKTVLINDRVWMAENLKTRHYWDGAIIPLVPGNDQWVNLNIGMCCYPNNDSTYFDTYGLLYNWYAVDSEHKLAPRGWHIPTVKEWQELIDYCGTEVFAADHLRETGNSHWNPPNTSDDQFGFTALPAGFRHHHGAHNPPGTAAVFWSSYKNVNCYYCLILPHAVFIKYHSPVNGYSIRLIKDKE